MTTYIINTSIIPSNFDGMISIKTISIETAKALSANATSAVGHEATAKVCSQILGQNVPMNRLNIQAVKGDSFIVFQLIDRLAEGKILSELELKALKFKFKLMTFE